MIQAMPEHSDLDGDSADSSVTNLALEEPEAMQSEAIEKEVISIADIPAAAAGITVPPGGENKLYEQDQQLQVSEGIKEMTLAEGMSDPFSIEKFTMADVKIAAAPTAPSGRASKKLAGPRGPEKHSRLEPAGNASPASIKAEQLRMLCTREGIRKPGGKQCTSRKKTMVHAIVHAKLHPEACWVPKKLEVAKKLMIKLKDEVFPENTVNSDKFL